MDVQKLNELRELLLKYSYQKKAVQLASGRKSDFYFDGKQTTLHPRGAALVGTLLLEVIRKNFPQAQAVGGPTLGADPMATAVSVISQQSGHPLFAFLIRKEPKAHGTMSWIEGAAHLKPGMKVVLVEDVITSGGSILKAYRVAKEAGLDPLGVIVLVDREDGGRQALEAEGLKVVSLFTKSELLSEKASDIAVSAGRPGHRTSGQL